MENLELIGVSVLTESEDLQEISNPMGMEQSWMNLLENP
jgi:hypothetical protein